MITHRVERHIINCNHPLWYLIDQKCFQSKDLYNYANYVVRQEFFANNKWIRYRELFQLCKTSLQYKRMGSNTGQMTLKVLDKNWKSFFKANKDFKKYPSKYLGCPRPPKYLDRNGRFVLELDNNKVGIKEGKIYFKWKVFKIANNIFITKIPDEARIIQCRFIPKGSCYVMEVVYEIEVPEANDNVLRIAGIDLGAENFITMVNNIGLTPIIVKGGVLKSINQYYNKAKAHIQSELKRVNGLNWSKRLQQLTDKRYEKIRYHMHCISKFVVNCCTEHEIDTLIVGNNDKWKQHNKGKQNFTYIPYEVFIGMLQYKCENKGIKCITVNEAYTSGTSFLDDELPIAENYNRKRRVHRGLFVSNDGRKINADVNAAYQIIKQVVPDAFGEGIEGVYLHPLSIRTIP